MPDGQVFAGFDAATDAESEKSRSKRVGAVRYRKIYPRIWTTREFLDLTEGERLVALYLLTGPQSNRIGLFRFAPGAAAEDLALGLKTFRKRLARVISSFDWHFDPQNRVIWIPSWCKFNTPEGPISSRVHWQTRPKCRTVHCVGSSSRITKRWR